MHVRQIRAGHVELDGLRAGGEQKRVLAVAAAVCEQHLPVRGVQGSCPEPWCSNGIAEQGWLLDQAARDGKLTATSSLSGAMVSSVM